MDAPAMLTRKHVPEDVGLRNAGEYSTTAPATEPAAAAPAHVPRRDCHASYPAW